MTVNYMYCRHNWEKFPHQVEAKLSCNPEIIFWNVDFVFQSYMKDKAFWKKVQVRTLNICEVIGFEECGYLNARKFLFQNTLRQSMCEWVPNTAETSRRHFYPNFLLISNKLTPKTSLLVRSEILGLFFSTLRAYHM